SCTGGYGALLRILWLLAHPESEWSDLPRPLIQLKPPGQFEIPLSHAAVEESILQTLEEFLAGQSAEFLAAVRLQLPPPGAAFYQNWFQTDLELLEAFFKFGPERNFRLRQRN